jgi:hypothetical protein
MTRQQAIREEITRYINACAYAATVRDEPEGVAHARRMAHIHALALGRLRGQTVAPWIHEADQYLGCGCHIEYGGCPTCCGGPT